MRSETIAADSGGLRLEGTLTRPEGTVRAMVIFVHGSGPLDRDENAKGAPLNVFNRLAEAFGRSGIASIRYDKRGCGASEGRYLEAGQADLTDDLCAWIGEARRICRAPLILCGHSEGTALAPAAAEREPVDGLILICPYARKGEAILRWQAEHGEALVRDLPGLKGRVARVAVRIFGGPRKMQDRLITKARRSQKGSVRIAGKPVPARWFRDFLDSDVLDLHRRQTIPTLLLVAGADVQCPPEDGSAIATVNPKAELRVIEGLSHLLRFEEAPGFLDYPRQLKTEMSPVVAEEILGWLDRRDWT